MNVHPEQLNSLALAYIGDAVYELYVRRYLLRKGNIRPNKLHHEAIKFVSATAQAEIIHYMQDNAHLTDEEKAVVRRGRNAKASSIPKNMSIQSYRYATALEALIGYLYLKEKKERLEELFQLAIQAVEKE